MNPKKQKPQNKHKTRKERKIKDWAWSISKKERAAEKTYLKRA